MNGPRGVQSGKIEPIKTKPNRNRESSLDLVIPNIPNEYHFRKPRYMDMVWYINRSNRINRINRSFKI